MTDRLGYVGIADDIDRQIRRGEGPAGAARPPANLRPGCRLRTRTQLAKLYGQSTTTIYMAQIILRERRLVRGEQGRSGLVVRPADEWLPVPPPDPHPDGL